MCTIILANELTGIRAQCRDKGSGVGIQIVSLQDNYLSVECCWTETDIIHSDLHCKQKQKMCSRAFCATLQNAAEEPLSSSPMC